MRDDEKQGNVLQKSGGVNVARFLNYVSPFFNSMHERVNLSKTNVPIIKQLTNCFNTVNSLDGFYIIETLVLNGLTRPISN